jgi:hypothetical protein
MLPHLNVEVMEINITKQDFEKVILSCLTSNQILFIYIVDYNQSPYLTNLKKTLVQASFNKGFPYKISI